MAVKAQGDTVGISGTFSILQSDWLPPVLPIAQSASQLAGSNNAFPQV